MRLILNDATNSMCIDSKVFHNVPRSIMDLLPLFIKNKGLVSRETFFQKIKLQRHYGDWWDNIKVKSEQNSNLNRIWWANRYLIPRGLMILTEQENFKLIELKRGQVYNSKHNQPKKIKYSDINIDVIIFKEGITFRPFKYEGALYQRGFRKKVLYWNEKLIRHEFYSISELKQYQYTKSKRRKPNYLLKILEAMKRLDQIGYI